MNPRESRSLYGETKILLTLYLCHNQHRLTVRMARTPDMVIGPAVVKLAPSTGPAIAMEI